MKGIWILEKIVMPRRLIRLSLVLAVLLSSEVWAIGLGDIQLDSALNEPLRAEIELLSATAEELAALKISLAPREIFDRYGIDRPAYLQTISFRIVGTASGDAVIRLSTPGPITEPFLTFLVEASWPSGRLLREYTVLLDPPTYAPPAVQQAPAVTAPTVSDPADSGRIERQPAPVVAEPPRRPAPEPVSAPPEPRPAADEQRYDETATGDYVVRRGDSLWGIAARVRPDDRLTMNQTMLAIYESNPEAFGGNINLLKAGAMLRIPSADEIFRISRGDALTEVRRQNTRWQTGAGPDRDAPRTAETRPSLVLVPPDEAAEAPPAVGDEPDVQPAETLTREQEIENRIAELESADVPEQRSLIEIRDNELANLRRELANIRGEVYEPPPAATGDDPFVEEAAPETEAVEPADAAIAEDTAAEPAEDAPAPVTEAPADATTTVVRTPRVSEPGIVDRALDAVRNLWPALLGGLVIIGGLLFWRARRGRETVPAAPPWQPLDSDDAAVEDEMVATKTIPAPVRDDDSILVIEGDSGIRPAEEPTAEMPILSDEEEETADPLAAIDETTSDTFGSIEDTFSSDTAVNLDQTDPIAEADFHMAYGLYDQAADLINGALETDPGDRGLLAKLCEVYFVWGNRDSFIDAATRLKSTLGDGDAAEWDKIVIMGQQIASDDELFADAGLTAATQAVDLSFDADEDSGSELDIDFGAESDSGTDIIDLGAEDDSGDSNVIDFGFDDADAGVEATNEMETLEIPAADSDKTVETPTVQRPLDDDDAGSTAELPAAGAAQDDEAIGTDAAETAELNLDDLGLEIDDLPESELAALDDLDDLADDEDTGQHEDLDLEKLIKPDDTGEMRLAKDETGSTPALQPEDEATDVDIDSELLDKTGMTQVLDEEGVDAGELGDDDATLQSPTVKGEFDFARTEALPSGAFSAMADLEETGEMPAIAETDVDLDLEDLTAALKTAEIGDAEEFLEDDTAEQPRPSGAETMQTAEMPTMELAPDDLPDELKDARTMTEVGTKLDLARAYVDMGDPGGARSILEEVLEEGDESQRQQAQQLLDTLPG